MDEQCTNDKTPYAFEIAAFEDNGYVEVHGPGNMNVAPILKDICYAMIAEGKRRIFVNMEHCSIVDSTFMGTLVNIHDRFKSLDVPEGDVYILNLNADNRRLFTMVGIHRIIETITDDVDIPDFKTKRIEACEVDREEKLRVVVEAHEKLIEINEVNREKFEKFLDIVKREMREEGIGGND